MQPQRPRSLDVTITSYTYAFRRSASAPSAERFLDGQEADEDLITVRFTIGEARAKMVIPAAEMPSGYNWKRQHEVIKSEVIRRITTPAEGEETGADG